MRQPYFMRTDTTSATSAWFRCVAARLNWHFVCQFLTANSPLYCIVLYCIVGASSVHEKSSPHASRSVPSPADQRARAGCLKDRVGLEELGNDRSIRVVEICLSCYSGPPSSIGNTHRDPCVTRTTRSKQYQLELINGQILLKAKYCPRLTSLQRVVNPGEGIFYSA